jgi:hypothetical protein
MDLSKVKTPALIKTWNNLKKGLDEVDKTIQKGTFHKVGVKGAASPAQAGQLTLWFALAVHQELTKRGAKF